MRQDDSSGSDTEKEQDEVVVEALLGSCAVLCDIDGGKEFILCEYNRDADSYRSPWSSKYHPPLEDGTQPSPELRKLEIEANEIFAIYRDQ